MNTATVLPCTNCGNPPQRWRCQSDSCKKTGQSIKTRKQWNARQAGNAILRLIERYKELHGGSFPEQLPLPKRYIECLPKGCSGAMFGVRIVERNPL